MVKVWSYLNMGNMRIENLFTTRWNFVLEKVDETYIKKYIKDEVVEQDFEVDEETGEVISKRKRPNFKKN